MPTTTQKFCERGCQSFLIACYGTDHLASVDDPLQTITTKSRLGWLSRSTTLPPRHPLSHVQPRELARSQGFPNIYLFTGSREAVVKQIGNAVPPNTAKALISEVLV